MTRVVLDVNGFFDHTTGARGLTRERVVGEVDRARRVLIELAAKRAAGELPFFDLPHDAALRAAVHAQADRLEARFDRLVVLGIGGSALGTRAVLDAVPRSAAASSGGANGGKAGSAGRAGLQVDVLDNIDPAVVGAVLDGIDLERTAFNVISKSGTTAETMSQFLIVRERLIERFGERKARERLVFTTDPEHGLLRQIASEEGIETLAVPDGVGGRFSVLSAVGLLPLAAAGVDIEALCAGARAADEACSRVDVWSNPAALHALLLALASQDGASIHVLMPYCDALGGLAEWYGQLWAESLGKRLSLDGEVVETGQTPVRAIGATDQHSQVQLYMEGPRDKVVTFLRVLDHGRELVIPHAYEGHQALAYLGGRGLGELLNMEQRATELALAAHGRPTSTIELERVDTESIGYLFHLFEVQTLVTGGLWNIDPLDQPGVEAGKVLTQGMAGRAGFEDKAAEVAEMLARKKQELVLG